MGHRSAACWPGCLGDRLEQAEAIAVNTWLPGVSELKLFAPELTLLATIVAVLMAAVLAGRSSYLAAFVAMAGAIASLVVAGATVELVAGGGRGGLTPPGQTPMLVADRLTVFYRVLLLMFVVMIVWLWSCGRAEAERQGRIVGSAAFSHEFFALLLCSALGMLCMVSTLNLLVMVIAIEAASLPSYLMVAADRRSRAGAEAALKYVMFGAAASAVMIYGVSILYGRFGTLDVGVVAAQLAVRQEEGLAVGEAGLWVALVALGAGIAFKIAAVPMHLWCPDVFEGAPIEVTTWLSVASKAAGLGLLLRIVDAFGTVAGEAAAQLMPLSVGVGLLAAVTCTLGNLAAFRQQSVKRILAYSSIAHAGYMMMAAAILVGRRGQWEASQAAAALVAYLSVYVVMNLGAFGATALVVWHSGSDHLSVFTGLGRRAPLVALAMTVCLFSLVGLPPLGGFAAKWYLLVALGRAASEQRWLWVLVMVAVGNTALSLYYYVRIIRQMYLVEDRSRGSLRPAPGGVVLVGACAVALVLLGTVWFSRLGSQAEVLASNLFEPGLVSRQAADVGTGAMGAGRLLPEGPLAEKSRGRIVIVSDFSSGTSAELTESRGWQDTRSGISAMSRW
jgi:NADH-quinone oxidoreductase subunit N